MQRFYRLYYCKEMGLLKIPRNYFAKEGSEKEFANPSRSFVDIAIHIAAKSFAIQSTIAMP